jgi:hypothetical protein
MNLTSHRTALHSDHRLDRDEAMNVQRRARLAPVAVAVLSALTLAACGGGGGDGAQDDRAEPLNGPKATEVVPGPSNVVTRWHEAAIATINVPASPTGTTIEERVGGPDIATVQVAVYDAAMAIAGTQSRSTPRHRPPRPALRWKPPSPRPRTAC